MNFTKTVPFFFILLFFLSCNLQKNSKNPLLAPDNWRSEIIEFPLEFAPSLSYSGTEYIQFAPGWGKKNAEDYFSYVLLWKINQDPKLSSKKLEVEMETYFDGLMEAVSKSDSNAVKNIPKPKAFFEKVNDSVYAGKILTQDAFITKKEVSLNTIVNTSYCNEQKQYLVLFKVSPQKPEHPIWKKMEKVLIDLECN